MRRFLSLVMAVVLAMMGALVAGEPARAAVPDVWAFAYSDLAAPPVNYSMDPTRQAGTYLLSCPGQQATVTGVAAGVYQVRFPCTAASDGIVHVTAVDASGAFCQAGEWAPKLRDELITVYCFDAAGLPAWATFTVLFVKSSGAAVGRAHGYAHVSAAGGLLSSFNSTLGTVSALRTSAGRYRVILAGLAPGGFAGSLQLTPVEPRGAPRHCTIADWNVHLGTDQAVYVSCFDATGGLTDTSFTLSYHHKATIYGVAAPRALVAYIFGPLPRPLPDTDINTAGGVNVLTPSGVGHYDLTFPLVAHHLTHMQVATFSNRPVYCNLTAPWLVAAPDVAVDVTCFAPGGARAPAAFFITYAPGS